jgi:hypothetical protein
VAGGVRASEVAVLDCAVLDRAVLDRAVLDRRTARANRTRMSVVDALPSLIDEGDLRPRYS